MVSNFPVLLLALICLYTPLYSSGLGGKSVSEAFKKACKLEAALVRNYDLMTDLLTGLKCRPISVAKNKFVHLCQ